MPSSSPYHHLHIQSADGAFSRFAWHDSVSALWSQNWRAPCSRGVYPFGEGDVADFDPIFQQLVQSSGDDPAILYRPDDFAAPFLAAGDALVADAEAIDTEGDPDFVRRLYLRAAAVYRIARYPAIRTARTELAWTSQQRAYAAGAALLDVPAAPVEIPFARADVARGDRDAKIQAIWRAPGGPVPAGGRPVVLLVSGLDGYRLDQTAVTDVHVAEGLATVTIDIPGTADSPAAPGDPESADRLIDSVLDWIADQSDARGLRADRVILHGLSTGGYHAARAAHRQADRLFAVVAHGGGAHHMFDPDWIDAADAMEFPFALVEALAWKFGFRDGDAARTRADYRAHAGERFSLLTTGVLSTPSAPMLVVNGIEDSIFPVEDSILIATETEGVDLELAGGLSHMGEPRATPLIVDWIGRRLRAAP